MNDYTRRQHVLELAEKLYVGTVNADNPTSPELAIHLAERFFELAQHYSEQTGPYSNDPTAV